MAKLKAEVVPFYLAKIEEFAAKNGDHLACGKLTWADVALSAEKEYIAWILGEDFEKIYAQYPHINAVIDKVREIPSIKKWIEERPKTMC